MSLSRAEVMSIFRNTPTEQILRKYSDEEMDSFYRVMYQQEPTGVTSAEDKARALREKALSYSEPKGDSCTDGLTQGDVEALLEHYSDEELRERFSIRGIRDLYYIMFNKKPPATVEPATCLAAMRGVKKYSNKKTVTKMELK